MGATLHIRHLKPDELAAAGALIGRALRDSPVLQKMFPANEAKRAGLLGEVYGVLLRQTARSGVVFGAFAGDRLVGACAVDEPGRCAPSPLEQLTLGRAVTRHTSLGTARAFSRWRDEIRRRHPEARHWHLGPVAVEPRRQGQGIGSALMEMAMALITARREPAFLATDQAACVPFFARYGFRDLLQAAILGVPHRFLLRPPG